MAIERHRNLELFCIVLGRFFFAVAAVLEILRLLRPARLEISDEGILFFSELQTIRYYWNDITDIKYQRVWDGFAPHLWVNVSLRPGHRSGPKQFTGSKDLGAIEGRGWPMPAEELANILISARARHTGF
ncbi:MAG TPA: hypothetical protein VIJ85_04320 [Rhizomicrobium sp.]